jgi:uncharacterized protein YheU (UPF0270 family)
MVTGEAAIFWDSLSHRIKIIARREFLENENA